MKPAILPRSIPAFLFILKLAAGCATPGSTTLTPFTAPSPTEPPSDFIVPPGGAPTLDGVLAPGEWDGARVETFSDGSQLLLLVNDGYLYLGLRGSKAELTAGNVFLDRDGEVAILHSSAALGTAIYSQGPESWERTQDFDWRCREIDQSPAAVAARQAFLEQERWVAANARMGTPNELEYMIEVDAPMVRLAVNLVRSSDPQTKPVWPPDLSDGTTLPTLGEYPAHLHFEPERWVTVGLPAD